VLHQPEIKQVYGSYRYFVPCDATLDSEGLISKISDLFNLPEEAPLAHLKTISKYAEGRILIFLDNLETPWEPAESRKGVESVLAQLADIENVSLLVTLRGAERPYGIPWTRPTLKPLEPLDINAAIETFLAISDGNAQDDHLVPLLNAIDCVPLAVTLMASQAQYATCKDLLDRWHAQKTKMLTRGYEGKGSSLDVSISLSVQSERLQRNRQAVALLQVLSLLPDGSTVGSLESMMPAFMDLNTGSPLASPLGSPLSPSTGPGGMHSLAHSMSSLSLASQSSIGTAKTYSSTQAPQSQTKMDIPTALMTLQQVALASVSQTGLIQTLSPVREHVKAHLPMSLELFRAVFGYHRSLTKLAKETAYSYKMPEMIVVVATQIANIHGVILKGLDEIGGVMVEGEEMSPLSPFGSDSGSLSPSTTSTAAMTTAESVLALRKEAIEACCEISYFHSSTTEGSIMSLLRVALSRGVEIGDKRLEARTLDRMSAWEENDRGWELQKRAEKLFLELGESANEDLGQLYTQMVKNRRSSSEYDTATELAKKSVKLLEGSSNVLARARSLAALSDIMLLDSHVPECMEAAYKGLALIREEEYPGLAFSFYRELTRAMVYRSLFTKAVECGYRALQLLGNTSMYESAYSYNDLGDALYIQSRLTEAGQLFQKAYDIFAAFEQTKKLETEQMSLGAVALAQYDFSKATTHFCLALEGSIQGNRRANQALVVGLLGSVELFQGRLHTANAHYAECMRRFVLLKFGGSIHTCAYLMPWGDTLLRAGAIEDARTCYISSLVICRSNASLLGSAQSIMRIGDMFYATAVDEEGLKTAKSCYEVTFELIKYLGVNRHLAECLYRRSMIAWREADGDKAIQMLKLALTFFERGEDPRGLEYARIAWQQVSSGQQVRNKPLTFDHADEFAVDWRAYTPCCNGHHVSMSL
jgi:tetratricopeptide (TPR) repeat protein